MRFASLAACLTLAAAPVVVSFTTAPASPSAPLAPATWAIDTGHSHIGFRTLHVGVSHAHGRFNAFSGEVVMAENPADSKVEVTIEAKSIDTNSKQRDDHLRAPDFFNVVQYPNITFSSTKVTKREEAYVVEGNLELLGKSKPVTATMEMIGTTENPRMGKIAGFSGEFSFKRSDFGMNYGVDNGGVGDEVTVELAFEVKAQ